MSAPISDVPVTETPVERAERLETERPRAHSAGVVETRWKTVEEAREYRAWLEHEQLTRCHPTGGHAIGLTAAERKALRFLQRDPRTRIPPSDPLEFKRIADARVKRRTKAERRLENERRSLAGKRARARQLTRPDDASEAADIDTHPSAAGDAASPSQEAS